MEPYGEEGIRGIYTPHRVWIEARDGDREIIDLKEPRASFAGHVRDTKWDQLQRLYFLGYAMWNYLATPFIFFGTASTSRSLLLTKKTANAGEFCRCVRPRSASSGTKVSRAAPGTAQGRADRGMSQITDVTYFVALPFVFSNDGVAAGEATECLSANAAVMRAEVLSRKPDHAGAVAFSRTGNPLSGDFSDATLLRKFGDVPDDLSAL